MKIRISTWMGLASLMLGVSLTRPAIVSADCILPQPLPTVFCDDNGENCLTLNRMPITCATDDDLSLEPVDPDVSTLGLPGLR